MLLLVMVFCIATESKLGYFPTKKTIYNLTVSFGYNAVIPFADECFMTGDYLNISFKMLIIYCYLHFVIILLLDFVTQFLFYAFKSNRPYFSFTYLFTHFTTWSQSLPLLVCLPHTVLPSLSLSSEKAEASLWVTPPGTSNHYRSRYILSHWGQTRRPN